MKLICDDGITLLEITRALAKGGFAISPERSATGEHKIERYVTAAERAARCKECGAPATIKVKGDLLCSSCYMASQYEAQGAEVTV
jgi:hypothetical protein